MAMDQSDCLILCKCIIIPYIRKQNLIDFTSQQISGALQNSTYHLFYNGPAKYFLWNAQTINFQTAIIISTSASY